jgi:hypothetical protein
VRRISPEGGLITLIVMTISVHQAKTQFSNFLDLLEEGEEVLIERHAVQRDTGFEERAISMGSRLPSDVWYSLLRSHVMLASYTRRRSRMTEIPAHNFPESDYGSRVVRVRA